MKMRIIIEFDDDKHNANKLLKEIENLTMKMNPFDEPLIYVESKKNNVEDWKLEHY